MSGVGAMDQIIDVSALIDSRRTGAFQKLVFVLCGMVAFIEGFDTQSVGFVAPALSKAFALSPAALGLFSSVGLFGLMFGALLIAPIADRFGRKPVILGCVAVFALACLGVASARSVPVLFFFRLLAGLGIGGAQPNLIALTAEYCPARSRSFTIMVMFSGFTIGAVGAGVTVSQLVGPYGWSSVFVVGGVAPLLFLPVLAALLPESIRVLAFSDANRDKVTRLMARVAPDFAIPAGARFVPEAVSAARMSVLELFRHGRARVTILLWLLFFMSLVVVYLLSTWLTTAMHARGFSPATSALISALEQAGGVVATFPIGWLSSRREPTKLLVGAYLFGAVCIGLIDFTGSSIWVIGLVVFGAGVGIIGGQGAANALVASVFPTGVRSTAVGWALGIGRIGSVIGPSLAGYLLAAHLSIRNLFLLAMIPAVIAALAALAIGKTRGLEG